MDTNKKKILITGGTSGIGLAIARRSLQEGISPIMLYLSSEFNAENAKELCEKDGFISGADFLIAKVDVSKRREIEEFFTALSSEIKQDICHLVNSAATLKRGSVLSLNVEDWQETFSVNILGIVNMSKAFYEQCPHAESIVNIGSIRGEPEIARSENAAYSVSKSAIHTLTAILAKTFKDKVRVNTVSPGTTDTNQRKGVSEKENIKSGYENAIVQRLGKPEEVSDMVLYLLSEKSSYITGSNFIIDGGYSINYIK
jgi:3-oxoacyl-[acyl-carrier protein] reductase